MRTLWILAAVVALTPIATARVWTTVYRCDEVTPLAPVDPNHPTVYRDIMVGTHLTIVVSSDTPGPWVGRLLLSWDDANDATLSGRGYRAEPPNYTGSCLASAGKNATILDHQGEEGIGFELSNDGLRAVPGNWFIFDYCPEQIGSVEVRLYDVSTAAVGTLTETLSLTQVASRDFNSDGIVSFEDLALLAMHWRSMWEPRPNDKSAAFDLNVDGRVDAGDLASFSEYWLERTDCNEPPDASK